MKVESKYKGIQKGFGEVVSLYHVICSYIAIVQLEGINGNRRQSSVFYLAPSLICGEGLLVNSRRSIFHIADPMYAHCTYHFEKSPLKIFKTFS